MNILQEQPELHKLQKEDRETIEIVWAYDEKGQRAHGGTIINGIYTRKKTEMIRMTKDHVERCL